MASKQFSDKERERAARYLTVQLYRSQCPGVTRLNHYCAGLLSENEAASIARHVQECPLCAEDVAHIRHTLSIFEPFPLEEK